MQSITIYFDEELIRVIEFRFSSNRVKKVKYNRKYNTKNFVSLGFILNKCEN